MSTPTPDPEVPTGPTGGGPSGDLRGAALSLPRTVAQAAVAPLIAVVAAILVTSLVLVVAGSSVGDFWSVILSAPSGRNLVNITNQTAMISEVRAVLLLAKRRIDYVVQTLLTYGGAPSVEYPNRGQQQTNLCEQLGLFLNASTDRVLALGQFIADEVGPTDYVAAFLRPPPPPGSETPWPPTCGLNSSTFPNCL